jgi:tetratricopeptide (TPR) repeat protein
MHLKCVIALVCAGVAAAQAVKQYKDGEYVVYNAVVKDAAARDWTRALADLDAWKQKCPQSDYEAERQVLYIQAYAGAKQLAQVVERAAELLPKLDVLFADPKDGPGQALQVVYNATVAVAQLPDPTPQQTAAGEEAARRLMSFDRRPAGLSDADWNKLRSDLQAPAKAALVYLAMAPGNRAMKSQPRDCAAAVTAYHQALEKFPDSAAISFYLGSALNCEKKIPEAIYQLQRAAVLDPTLGSTRDAAQVRSIADGAYTKYHGSADGLEQLKVQVKESPFPPAGFAIRSGDEVAAEQDAAFEAKHPQLALWKKIREALVREGGDEYFKSQLQGAGVPQLIGTLVEGRPACRPKELLIAVPSGDASDPKQGEILIRLAGPLSGKPEPGTEVRWEGVPSAFSRTPFLLTMDAENRAVQVLKTSPCGTPPRKK